MIKPKLNVLKNIFPYSYVDAFKQIRTFPYTTIKYSQININGNLYSIKDEYYNIFEKYIDYKIIFSNEYFNLLIKRH